MRPGDRKNLDNSARQPLTGWKLWWRLFKRSSGLGLSYYRDSAFPACPACGSPNVMLEYGQSYLCLEQDCESDGSCEVMGSNGVTQRKAQVRVQVATWAVIAAGLVSVLVLVLTGHANSPGGVIAP